jgi:flagellum-specific peptidoglycan hydrolase FlgJ
VYLRRERRRNMRKIKKRKIKRVRRVTRKINKLNKNRFKLSSKTRAQFIKRMAIRSTNKADSNQFYATIIIIYSLDIL